jgi:uncharacterized integral membrane protein
MTFLSRLIGWTLAALVGLVAVLLMVGSREPVALQMALVPGSLEMPLFAAILLAWVVGFICGAVVMWFSDGRWRRLAREEMAERQQARAENETLKQSLADARAAADAADAARTTPAPGDALHPPLLTRRAG